MTQLTERDCKRIWMASWRAYIDCVWPVSVGEHPRPFTEIHLDEYTKRLYIVENGTRRLHGPKRVRKVQHA